MKVRRGKEKLGEFQGVSLVMDWDDLFHYQGKLFEVVKTEKLTGRLAKWLGTILSGGVLFYLVFSGVGITDLLPAQGIGGLVFWAGLGLIVYSRFLRRDRGKFGFNLENASLLKLGAKLARGGVDEIEIDTHISLPVLGIIDDVYARDADDFFPEFVWGLCKAPRVKELLARLNLDQVELDRLVADKKINPRFDEHVALFVAAFTQAMSLGLDRVDEVAILLVLCQTVWKQGLLEIDVTPAEVVALSHWVAANERKEHYLRVLKERSVFKPKGPVNRSYTSRYAATVERFGEDYTRAAALGNFELSIGREEQLKQLIKILQKNTSAAALLTGDPGVGKSRLLHHLAVRMVVEDVPPVLQDKRLVAFDFNRAFTDVANFESFKSVLQNIFEEVAEAGNIVLALDNFDQVLNVRNDLKAEIVNQIVNGVDKYNIPLIALASTDGYNRLIKPVPSLASLFQVIAVPEPSAEIATQILQDAAGEIEQRTGVVIQVGAIKQIVQLAPKFAHERVMPDKGVDLLEEAALEAKDRGLTHLTEDVVNDIISKKIGVTVGKISEAEAEKLTKLEERMHKRVIGQDQAITAVANALRRSRAGLQKASKPIASFLFFGPTGVGKTEVAKTLAETYYGGEHLMTRIDMSEYQEEENLGRLIGRQENDSFTGGYLTEAIRQKPFSLVLFDEIEKANPKVLDLFLQLLDEGNITDGAGRRIDFTNAIIIATSNAGSRQIANLIAKGLSYHEVEKQVQPVLKQVFRIEFLNRFDKIIMFKPLLPLEIEKVAEQMLQALSTQLAEKGYRLEYTETTLKDLVKLGYNPIYGAREMRRVVQEQIEDRIAEKVVRGELKLGGVVRFEELGV